MKEGIILSVIFLIFSCTSSYVIYKPLTWDGENYNTVDTAVNKDFIKNFIKVLKYYDVDYKFDADSNILIPKKLYDDEEVLYNYTKKAKDIEWLEGHQVQDK